MVNSLYSKNLKLMLLAVLALMAVSDAFAMKNGKRKAEEISDQRENPSEEPKAKRQAIKAPQSDPVVTMTTTIEHSTPTQIMAQDEVVAIDMLNSLSGVIGESNGPKAKHQRTDDELRQNDALNNLAVAADMEGLISEQDMSTGSSVPSAAPTTTTESNMESDTQQSGTTNAPETAADNANYEISQITPDSKAILNQISITMHLQGLSRSYNMILDFLSKHADQGLTVLHAAILYSSKPNLKVIKYIIDTQSDLIPDLINAKDKDGWTALHYLAAAYIGKKPDEIEGQEGYVSKACRIDPALKIMIMFFQAGADPNITDKTEHDPLYYAEACSKNKRPRIKLLEIAMTYIKSGMQIDARIMRAKEMFAKIMSKAEIMSNPLYSAIAYAIQGLREAKLIPEQDMSTGSSVPSDAPTTTTESNMESDTQQSGTTNAPETAADNAEGAISQITPDSKTITNQISIIMHLHGLSQSHKEKMIRFLNEHAGQGLTVLHVAILYSRNPNLKTIKEIIDAHPDLINTQDNDGWTALHYLAAAYTLDKSNNTNQIKLQSYASKVCRIDLALKIMIMFLLAGADPNITDNNKNNPLYYANACSTRGVNLRIELLEEAIKWEKSAKTRKMAMIARTKLYAISECSRIGKAIKYLRDTKLIPEQDIDQEPDTTSDVAAITTTTITD